ncbi:hypothetical protein Glove_64g52 [Diversispora epigaea]|uniref:Uncharacterized protein n=1 Tax=Diversispora epigaea TaxID=1348612 RepID=A0A397JBZ3_9GLOM|nr:hypothetical protein Glove_64g52 [Diversispora epigaea]
MVYGICPECNQKPFEYGWCKTCNSKHFQNDFNKWTSGNNKIDNSIQDAQLNANDRWEVIEWIPFDRFKKIDGLMDELKNGILKIINGKDMVKVKWH